jgi:chorismate synthase
MRNTFGNIFTLTTFGESHGSAVGGVVDGMPAGIDVDIDFIQQELNRRKPGQSNVTTSRQENDVVEVLSGIFEGKSTGCPIGFIVRNTNQHSNDYENIRNVFRPSHADYTYFSKYGIRDHRGGGRSSARETVSRCVGGALAKLVLKKIGIEVVAYTSQVGHIAIDKDYRHYDFSLIESNSVRCPDVEKVKEMQDLILKVKAEGDTIGGIITCVVKGCPVGLGEPAFSKLHAELGAAMLGINAVKGFEYGSGFSGIALKGSEMYLSDDQQLISGGIAGGISDGNPIVFRCVFKPTATNRKTLEALHSTLNSSPNSPLASSPKVGRHDACVAVRAVAVVEAMAALVVQEFLLSEF